jgi:hypothetical protein
MKVLLILFIVAFVFINKLLLNKITHYINLLVFKKQENGDEHNTFKKKPLSIVYLMKELFLNKDNKNIKII